MHSLTIVEVPGRGRGGRLWYHTCCGVFSEKNYPPKAGPKDFRKGKEEKEEKRKGGGTLAPPSHRHQSPASPPPSPRPTRETEALAAQRRPAIHTSCSSRRPLAASADCAACSSRRASGDLPRQVCAVVHLRRQVHPCASHRAMRIVFSLSLDRLPQSAAARGVCTATHRGGADLQLFLTDIGV